MLDPSLFQGQIVQDVEVFSQRVDLWATPVLREFHRRHRLGVGPLTDHGLIRALKLLSAAAPEPITGLDGQVLGRLGDLLDVGAVVVERDMVRRVAVPPIDLTGIAKWASSCDSAAAVTLLRTHAPRVVVANSDLARWALRELDRDVGVVEQHIGQTLILRSPGCRHVRPTWQRWVTAEAAFASWPSATSRSEALTANRPWLPATP